MLDRNDKFYLTTAEMLVMRVIWLEDHDLVLSEVVKLSNESYGKDWKPQTVSTYLSHLVQKEFLKMERSGKIYTYHPLVTREEFRDYDISNFIQFWNMSPREMMENYLTIRPCTEAEKEEMKAYIESL